MSPRAPGRLYSAVKRALDMGVSAAGLVLAAPLLASAATTIRLTMGNPILFRQVRPGLHGRPFELVKLRTMTDLRPGEDLGSSDRERLTLAGRFLRATSIDELPTLWNVLRGDMTLVGPRPLLLRYLGRYTPEQARRHEVKPGITGWVQVNGRNALTWEEKFELDVWYVDHRSLKLDLVILAMTGLRVLKRTGVTAPGEATMSEFMGNATDAKQERNQQ